MRIQRQNKLTDYEGFVEKFKPKKTTDDCLTPAPVYDALLEWARENIRAIQEAKEIVRPFWPGFDYEAYDYPQSCAVVDNPPFSILASIVDNYQRAGIPFLLFAPHLTLFNVLSRPGITAIVTNAAITYANGAVVSTSFFTNCWPTDTAVVISGRLKSRIKAANKVAEKGQPKKMSWPSNLISSALLGKCINPDFELEIPRRETLRVTGLDSGQRVYGSGLWVSDRIAAELRAAELRAAEMRADEMRAAADIKLSETERLILKRLNGI